MDKLNIWGSYVKSSEWDIFTDWLAALDIDDNDAWMKLAHDTAEANGVLLMKCVESREFRRGYLVSPEKFLLWKIAHGESM